MAHTFLSCEYIESGLFLGTNDIQFCCVPSRSGLYAVLQDVSQGVFDFDNYFKLRSNSKSSPLAACERCPHYRRGSWNYDGKLHTITIANTDVCNFKCEYCYTTTPGFKYHHSIYNVFDFLEQLAEHNLISKNCNFILVTGEPALNKDLPMLLEYADKFDGYVSIASNCSVFSPAIEHNLKKRTTVTCSLDAGTRELFFLMKGVDKFDDTVRNLHVYVNANANNVYVKYIVYERNYALQEVIAFVRQMYKINVRHIIFDLNSNNANMPIRESFVFAIAVGKYFAEKLAMEVGFQDIVYSFGEHNIRQLVLNKISSDRITLEYLFNKEFLTCKTALTYEEIITKKTEGYFDRDLLISPTDNYAMKMRKGEITPISGWLVNKEEEDVFDKMFIRIGKYLYPVSLTGIYRQGVSEYLKSDRYEKSAFYTIIDANLLPSGEHLISMIGLSANGEYYESMEQLSLCLV